MFENSSDCCINAGNYIISLSVYYIKNALINQDTPVYTLFSEILLPC